MIFKNSAPFIDCVTEINNTQVDNAKNLNLVMPMYNVIEYSDNYSGTISSMCQYHKNEPDGPTNDSSSFKFKSFFLANINESGIINAEIAGSLKYVIFGELLKCIKTIVKLVLL